MQNKKPSMGEYGYFLELHNTKCNVKFLMSSINNNTCALKKLLPSNLLSGLPDAVQEVMGQS